MDKIIYRPLRSYKYQTMAHYNVTIPIEPEAQLTSKDGWVVLTPGGLLMIRKGYCWDGPSGPAIDTKNFMRPSLVHDALYQLIREKLLPIKFRKDADEILRLMCLEDGMSKIRANWVYLAVKTFAQSAVTKWKPPPIEEAP